MRRSRSDGTSSLNAWIARSSMYVSSRRKWSTSDGNLGWGLSVSRPASMIRRRCSRSDALNASRNRIITASPEELRRAVRKEFQELLVHAAVGVGVLPHLSLRLHEEVVEML